MRRFSRERSLRHIARGLLPILALMPSAPGRGATQGGEGKIIQQPSRITDRPCTRYRLQDCRATRVSSDRAEPAFEVVSGPDPVPDQSLEDALDAAYRNAPSLQAERYRLRAADDDYARALAELRPSSTIDVVGSYTRTLPGRETQFSIDGSSSALVDNSMDARVTAVQPLYTGGRAAAAQQAGLATVGVGRAQLQSAEGDLMLRVVSSYANIRRDQAILRLRDANLRQLSATLEEVKARRQAGELTRTDIAQAETQLAMADAQHSLTQQQLEQDIAIFSALVGREPGILAPLPPLPSLPESLAIAVEEGKAGNPDMHQAIATERVSRAAVAAAGAQGRPSLTVQGSAGLTGDALPYRLRNQDRRFEGRAILSIPLTGGGRVASAVAGARNRNIADVYGMDDARRRIENAITQSWSAIEAARRNIRISEVSVTSAHVLDEGTFLEYRAGLRNTFDVLFAHAALRDAEISRTNAYYDLYVAAATLLRQTGALDIHLLSPSTSTYDPVKYFNKAKQRNGLPWDSLLRSVDHILQTAPTHGDAAVLP